MKRAGALRLCFARRLLVVLLAGVVAASALLRGRGNPPYALVFLWALAAIYAALLRQKRHLRRLAEAQIVLDHFYNAHAR